MIAATIWAALGQPSHYLEPFCGSAAVLLSRPHHNPQRHIETIVDADGYVANVWRALQAAPDEVARWCDWPVNHADLSARKRCLLANEARLLENLSQHDEWYDAKLAGYWVWASSCWIGSGLTRLGQRPNVGDGGKGVHALGQRPHVSEAGMGVHALGQIPHVGSAGKGVHALGQIPHVSDAGKGVQEPYNTNLYVWFRALAERLRYVRVVCGDWTRVCGGDWQNNMGTVGMFFDPPYGVADRDTAVYHHDSTTVAAEVEQWVLPRGARSDYRIGVAGYTGEHDALAQAGWRTIRWKAHGGYGRLTQNGEEGRGLQNRHREALWLSPHCAGQRDLFSLAEEAEEALP